jgi:hypothetical protein
MARSREVYATKIWHHQLRQHAVYILTPAHMISHGKCHSLFCMSISYLFPAIPRTTQQTKPENHVANPYNKQLDMHRRITKRPTCNSSLGGSTWRKGEMLLFIRTKSQAPTFNDRKNVENLILCVE